MVRGGEESSARLPHVGPALVLALGGLAGAAAAQAPAEPTDRPEAFYVLSRAPLPPLDAADLPEPARATYRSWREARQRVRRHSSRTSTQRLRRLEAAVREADAALHAVLLRQRDALGPAGWLLFGDVVSRREADLYLAEMRSYEVAVRTWGDDVGVEPVLDQRPAVQAWRRAAAGESASAETRTWARYLEAFAWIQMRRSVQADAALRVVVAAGESDRLVRESCFRLGDHAFDRGEWEQSIGWYRCARTERYGQLEALTAYKGAWALWLAGRAAEALAMAAEVPADAPENVLTDVERLRGLIAMAAP